MVNDMNLVPMIEELEMAVAACAPDALHECRTRLHAMLADLDRAGHPVPQRLRALEDLLADAEVEDQFDNLPV